MDWSNENFVRLYTRETDDDLVLSWQARAVWHEMLKKFDRSGLIAMRRGRVGLAAVLRLPYDLVDGAMPELLMDGRVKELATGYFAPNFMEAQEATKSDKQRQKESRERRRAKSDAVTKRDANVTNSDEESNSVTDRDSDVTFRDRSSRDPHPTVTLTSAVSVSDRPEEDLSRTRAIPPTTEPIPKPPAERDTRPLTRAQIDRLCNEAWSAAKLAHELLRTSGVDKHAVAWTPFPIGVAQSDIRERAQELGERGDEAYVRETFQRVIAVRAAEAKRLQPPSLKYFIPTRMFQKESFWKSAELSPQQAGEQQRAPARSAEPRDVRVVREHDAPPPDPFHRRSS